MLSEDHVSGDCSCTQARAAALLRQNMELQNRQSSLERRAAFQKGLMAANRDHMQVRNGHGIADVPTSMLLYSAGFPAISAVSGGSNNTHTVVGMYVLLQ